MSIIEVMVSNYLLKMSTEQKKQLLRGALDELLASTSAQERTELLREVVRTLVASLPP